MTTHNVAARDQETKYKTEIDLAAAIRSHLETVTLWQILTCWTCQSEQLLQCVQRAYSPSISKVLHIDPNKTQPPKSQCCVLLPRNQNICLFDARLHRIALKR